MSVKIYVGNLPFSTTDNELRDLFGQFGEVESARIVTDRETGRSRGFAFVEMSAREGGDQAIERLNGREVGGRSIVVNEARPAGSPDATSLLPSTVAPSLNVTRPATTAGVTVATIVTGCVSRTGFGDTVMAVDVVRSVTVWLRTGDVLGAFRPSPE